MAGARRPRANRRVLERAADATRQRVPKRLSGLGVHRDEHPLWRLSLMDIDGRWGFGQISGEELRNILRFLREMERLTWTEIRAQMTGGRRRGPLHKHVPYDSLIPEARKRAEELELDDYEDLFRFRLGNLLRLWGVVQDNVFYPVWWDRDHEICPGEGRD